MKQKAFRIRLVKPSTNQVILERFPASIDMCAGALQLLGDDLKVVVTLEEFEPKHIVGE